MTLSPLLSPFRLMATGVRTVVDAGKRTQCVGESATSGFGQNCLPWAEKAAQTLSEVTDVSHFSDGSTSWNVTYIRR